MWMLKSLDQNSQVKRRPGNEMDYPKNTSNKTILLPKTNSVRLN